VDIRGKIRECHDLGGEHDSTFPVIIALDVTGSMGHVPERLVKRDFPEIMKKILDAGVKDAQVCFVAVGDHECDYVPFQAGQFESSDEKLDNWLTRLYLEGGGGGNDGESYLLAWYFAARHVDSDAWNKRHQKGVLITIGDEPGLRSLPAKDRDSIFGKGQGSVSDTSILDEAREKWEVYHINLMDYSGKYPSTQRYWKQILGDHLINTETSDGNDIVDIIPKLVVDAFQRQGGTSGLTDDEEDYPLEEGPVNEAGDNDLFTTMAAMMAMQQMGVGSRRMVTEDDIEKATM
jgi:hypothetical protein